MGEAKRRGAKPPTPTQRASRWVDRLWLAYPRPFRPYFRFNLQLVVGVALVLGGLLVIALMLNGADWLLHR